MTHEYRPGRRGRTQVVAHVPDVGPVTAAGVLLTTRDGGALLLLEHGCAGDLGGKIDPPDVCDDPMRTAARAAVREVREESGMVLEEGALSPRFYFPRSKYLLFVAPAPEPHGGVAEVSGVDPDAPDFLRTLQAAAQEQTGRPLHKRLCFPIEKIPSRSKGCWARC